MKFFGVIGCGCNQGGFHMALAKAFRGKDELGIVFINPDHVTHIVVSALPDESDVSVIWLVSGKAIPVVGPPKEVAEKLFDEAVREVGTAVPATDYRH